MTARITLEELKERVAAEGLDPQQVRVRIPAWKPSAPYRCGVRSAFASDCLIIRDDGSGVVIDLAIDTESQVTANFHTDQVPTHRRQFALLFPEVPRRSRESYKALRARIIQELGWETYVERIRAGE